MTANVSITTARRDDVLRVPARALRFRPEGTPPPAARDDRQPAADSTVYVLDDDGIPKPVEVRIGREDGGRTEVLAGLSEGDKVVASGQFLLDSEANLNDVAPRPLAAEPMTANPR